MAVTEHLPGVTITVVVDGVDLKEYRDADIQEETRTITRYIEAVSGKNFEIYITLDKDCEFFGEDLSFRICVDGKWTHTPLMNKSAIGTPRVSFGIRVAETRLTKYMFTSLQTGKTHVIKVAYKMWRTDNRGSK